MNQAQALSTANASKRFEPNTQICLQRQVNHQSSINTVDVTLRTVCVFFPCIVTLVFSVEILDYSPERGLMFSVDKAQFGNVGL